MKERCEIDLSPGTRARAGKGGDLRAVAGLGRRRETWNFPGGMPAGRRFSFVAAVSYHGGPEMVIPCDERRLAMPGFCAPAFRFDSAANCG